MSFGASVASVSSSSSSSSSLPSSGEVEVTLPLARVEGKMKEDATGTVTLSLRVGGAAAARAAARAAAEAARDEAVRDAAWAAALARAEVAMAAEAEAEARREAEQASRRWDDFEDDADGEEFFIPGRVSSARWIDLSRGRPPDLGYSSCR